jgi:hypothetical protein
MKYNKQLGSVNSFAVDVRLSAECESDYLTFVPLSSSSMALRPVFGPLASPTFFFFRGFSWGFETNPSFTGWGCQPHAQPPTWRTIVPLFVWVITFDLSSMGAPASSYATAGIALRILRPRKPRHYVTVGMPPVGLFLYAGSTFIGLLTIVNSYCG